MVGIICEPICQPFAVALNGSYVCGSTILFCKSDSNGCFLIVPDIILHIVLCQSHLLQIAYYFLAENGNMYLFSFLL